GAGCAQDAEHALERRRGVRAQHGRLVLGPKPVADQGVADQVGAPLHFTIGARQLAVLQADALRVQGRAPVEEINHTHTDSPRSNDSLASRARAPDAVRFTPAEW